MANLIEEALADAKRVKSAALANAKIALEETFQPTLQRMISSKLAEEDGDEEEDLDIDINFGDEDEAGMEDGGEDQSIGMGSFDDGGDEEIPAEEEPATDDDMELEALMRELEGDDEMMDEGDEEDWSDPIPDVTEGEDYEDESMMEGDDEEISDDEVMEAILRELEGEDEEDLMEGDDDGGAFTETPPNPQLNSENRKLRTENKKLKGDLNKAFQAITTYKKTINEVNLLNAKLMYTTKTLRSFNLNENQQIRILESFDRASSVREVKLVYTTIFESFNKKPKKGKIMEGAASKVTKAINPKKPLNESYNNSGNIVNWSPSRLQELAGLKKTDGDF